MQGDPPPWTGPEGQYDVRKGAQGYAGIVATFGSLAVTAIVVVFSLTKEATTPQLLGLTAGLLSIGVFGSFLGAFGLAAVGAENDPTANLAAAIMFISIPVSLSILGIFGAFEVLATIYANSSSAIFAVITGASGVAGVAFTAYAIGDSFGLHSRRLEPPQLAAWRNDQWLKTQEQAYRKATFVASVGSIPPILGLILRWTGSEVTLDQTGVNWIIGAGIALSMLASVCSLQRSVHSMAPSQQRALRRWEAWSSVSVISIYSFVLLWILPA